VAGQIIFVSGTAGGDVVGPASSVANTITLFNGTTGKLIKEASNLTYASNTLTAQSGLTILSGPTGNDNLVIQGNSLSVKSGPAFPNTNFAITNNQVGVNSTDTGGIIGLTATQSVQITSNSSDVYLLASSGKIITNTDVVPLTSGTKSVGTTALPYLSSNAFTVYQSGTQVVSSGTGLGNITVTKSADVLTISGTQYILPTSLTGLTLVASSVISGTTISGNTISVGGNITFQTSGTSLIGTDSSPANTLFANEISGVNARGYVFAYDTTTQSTAVANTFQDITYNNSPTKDSWSHTSGTATFTCNLSGMYEINYTATMNRTGAPNTTPEIILTKNGTEIAGSQVGIILSSTNIPVEVSNSVILPLVSGDLIKTRLTSSNTTGQITTAGANAVTRPSIRLSIMKI